MGAVAHAPRPFVAASFLRRRLTVGAVAHAPRPSLGAVLLPTFKQMLLNASIITFDTIVASMMGKEEIGDTKITFFLIRNAPETYHSCYESNKNLKRTLLV